MLPPYDKRGTYPPDRRRLRECLNEMVVDRGSSLPVVWVVHLNLERQLNLG